MSWRVAAVCASYLMHFMALLLGAGAAGAAGNCRGKTATIIGTTTTTTTTAAAAAAATTLKMYYMSMI
jgi:hypothetical protein